MDEIDVSPVIPASPGWLMRVAIAHLARYPASAAHLETVLARRIVMKGFAREGSAELIRQTIERLKELQFLNDDAFAEARLATLRRRGASTAMAKARLADKGIDRETVERAMAGDETDERQAAENYARRRRLGPHRVKDRAERRERDIAAMARAGFPIQISKAVIDADPDEERD
ncbi:regulatory protein RecX [Aureimonas fodinaquatilis]|uniref:Regulatory protein RecX n=1 Tax=Aureimonas fodinaquatilis TaxID=2565783 RepID=A0A5B0E3E6_9HYPH|nr:regulatory protein RecX [Aureimonas fodinaquatilis]KAA0972280.1 regulatory protein RecX [Aureimonas fodinaquatilis]